MVKDDEENSHEQREDPLHVLSRTPTKASHNQQWAVWKEAERQRTRPIEELVWGTTATTTSMSPRRKLVHPPTPVPDASSSSPARTSSGVPNNRRARTLLCTPPRRTTPQVGKDTFDKTFGTTTQKQEEGTNPHRTVTLLSTLKHPAEKESTDEVAAVDVSTPEGARELLVDTETSTMTTTMTTTDPTTTLIIPEAVRKIDLPDKDTIRTLFRQLDENASGKLSLAELDKGVMILYPEWYKNKPAIMAAYKSADRSCNGFVELREFAYFLQYLVYFNNLWTVFDAMDTDDDRRVSKTEFVSAAAKMDLRTTDAEQVFDTIDANSGAMIFFDELIDWMATNRSTFDASEMHELQAKLQQSDRSITMVDSGKGSTTSPPADPIPDAVKKIQTPDEETALKLFDDLDENASGKLSLAELDKGMVVLFPEWNNKPAIMAAYKSADRSGNGFVERSEFGFFLQFIVYYNNLWSIFDDIDSDGDRRISKDEFLAAAAANELGMLTTDPEQVFDDIDTNSGGMILFDEFVHWMATNKSVWGDDSDDDDYSSTETTTTEEPANSLIESPALEEGKQIETPVPDKEAALKLFDRLDENASGKLSPAELDKGLMILYPQFNHKPAIMEAYKSADQSGDGFVERNEFGCFIQYLMYYNDLSAIFEAIDSDIDHCITKDEFVSAGSNLKSQDDAEQVFDEIDVDGEGVILFGELIHWMATNKSTWGPEELQTPEPSSDDDPSSTVPIKEGSTTVDPPSSPIEINPDEVKPTIQSPESDLTLELEDPKSDTATSPVEAISDEAITDELLPEIQSPGSDLALDEDANKDSPTSPIEAISDEAIIPDEVKPSIKSPEGDLTLEEDPNKDLPTSPVEAIPDEAVADEEMPKIESPGGDLTPEEDPNKDLPTSPVEVIPDEGMPEIESPKMDLALEDPNKDLPTSPIEAIPDSVKPTIELPDLEDPNKGLPTSPIEAIPDALKPTIESTSSIGAIPDEVKPTIESPELEVPNKDLPPSSIEAIPDEVKPTVESPELEDPNKDLPPSSIEAIPDEIKPMIELPDAALKEPTEDSPISPIEPITDEIKPTTESPDTALKEPTEDSPTSPIEPITDKIKPTTESPDAALKEPTEDSPTSPIEPITDGGKTTIDPRLHLKEPSKDPLMSSVEPIPNAVKEIEIPDAQTIHNLFRQLDENASGKLSLAELDKGVMILYPDLNHKPAIMAAYKAADQSGDAFVQRHEFGYFLRFLVYYNNLWTLFDAVDSDKDHRISKDEFLAAAGKLEMPNTDAEQVFDEMDANGGGMILFGELVDWMATNKSTWGSNDADVEEVQKRLQALVISE